MEIDAGLSEFLINVATGDVKEELIRCLSPTGKLVMGMDHALYGFIESGKLWYDTITAFLLSLGLTQNPRDPCIYNDEPAMDATGKLMQQLTVCLYVDDILVTCTSAGKIDAFAAAVQGRFKKTKRVDGQVHSYLGMTLDFTAPGTCSINMDKFIADVINDTHTVKTKRTPSTAELFTVDENSTPLRGGQEKEFHSMVARLLFASKRARIDIQCVVAFLCTRVKAPTEEDWHKLDHLLQYLNGTAKLGLKLTIGKRGMVHECFVDASFGVHMDRRSHTGMVDRIGNAVIDTKSAKQKINTSSSCEAELVAVSESLDRMVQTQDFLNHQGYSMKPMILLQDNESTMSLISHGRARSEATRHIDIKYYYVKDYVDRQQMEVQHRATEHMIADFFTKPLGPGRFIALRDILMGVYAEDDEVRYAEEHKE